MENARKTRAKKEDIGYGYDSVFPARLREMLNNPDMTQEKLAVELGVSRQSVAQWKDGKTMPDIYYLKKIAEYFGVSSDWLIGLTEVKSMDIERQQIGRTLGLSDNSIGNILAMKHAPMWSDLNRNPLDALNAILPNNSFVFLLLNLDELRRLSNNPELLNPNPPTEKEDIVEHNMHVDAIRKVLNEHTQRPTEIVSGYALVEFYKYKASQHYEDMVRDICGGFDFRDMIDLSSNDSLERAMMREFGDGSGIRYCFEEKVE